MDMNDGRLLLFIVADAWRREKDDLLVRGMNMN